MRGITKRLSCARALALLGALAATGCVLPSYEEAWSQKFGGIKVDEARAVAVDSCGNVIIAGRYESYMSFDGDETFVEPDTAGNMFVAKFDSAGGPLWSRRFGDAAIQGASRVAIDADDNILVAGSFMGALQIGDDTLANPNPYPNPAMPGSPPPDDVTFGFVAKLDEDGEPIWSRGFGDSSNTSPVTPTGLAVDSQGNALVVGNYFGPVDFGGGPIGDTTAMDSAFLVKYDADGGHVFSQSFDETARVNLANVAADADDNILVTGDHRSTLTIGAEVVMIGGGDNALVVKLDGSSARVLWARTFGSGFTENGLALAVDPDRNVLVTGRNRGMVDFGGGALASTQLNGQHTFDLFVLKLNPAGIHVWSRNIGGTGDEEGRAIAVDEAGDVLVTGISSGDLDFDGITLAGSGSADLDTDVYLAKLGGADGQARAALRFGDAMLQEVTGLAVSPENDVFLTGNFVGSLDFGGTPLESSNAEQDFFLARLMPLP